MANKNKKTVVNLVVIYSLLALTLSVLVGIGYYQKVILFSLSFSPLNVTTNGQVNLSHQFIKLTNIHDEIIIPNLKSGKLTYEVSMSGVFIVDQPFQEGDPLWVGCGPRAMVNTQEVLKGYCYWNRDDVFKITLNNFVTLNEDLIPLGVTINNIIIAHSYL